MEGFFLFFSFLPFKFLACPFNTTVMQPPKNDTPDWMSARGEERNKHTGEADKSAKCAKCHKQGKTAVGVSPPPPREKAQNGEEDQTSNARR